MRELGLEDALTAGQQVHIVEAFLVDDAGLEYAVALVLMVNDEQLVRLVLVDAELGENLVLLDVRGREADRVGDVACAVLFDGAQVEEDYFWRWRLSRWSARGELAPAEDLDVVKVPAKLLRRTSLSDVVS